MYSKIEGWASYSIRSILKNLNQSLNEPYYYKLQNFMTPLGYKDQYI